METCEGASFLQLAKQHRLPGWPLAPGRFEIDACVGTGTFGAVFRVHRVSGGSQETLAMKAVRRASPTPSREVAVLLRLRQSPHEHVLPLHEYFFASGEQGQLMLFTVTPYYDGSLTQLLDKWKEERVSGTGSCVRCGDAKCGAAGGCGDKSHLLAASRLFGQQIASALSHTHAMGIAHRDLKPENVLVHESLGFGACFPQGDVRRWRCILADFGSAKHVGEAVRSSPYVTTLNYRAPELFFAATRYARLVGAAGEG